jgi:hypothetical protein
MRFFIIALSIFFVFATNCFANDLSFDEIFSATTEPITKNNDRNSNKSDMFVILLYLMALIVNVSAGFYKAFDKNSIKTLNEVKTRYNKKIKKIISVNDTPIKYLLNEYNNCHVKIIKKKESDFDLNQAIKNKDDIQVFISTNERLLSEHNKIQNNLETIINAKNAINKQMEKVKALNEGGLKHGK